MRSLNRHLGSATRRSSPLAGEDRVRGPLVVCTFSSPPVRSFRGLPSVDPGHPTARRGFTLIELLVAISILLILSALTFTMVNVTMDSDRIRSGSREVQSYLEGARNQAIYAKAPRGVRFLVSPDDP